MEKHSTSRLIGSPPGYIGFEKGGQLTEKVRQHPYSIVLFDEIEKANKDVLNLLLQILDNGFITDGRGKNINFRNTIIIMTSNLGNIEEGNKKMTADELKNVLLKHLTPEFVNRIDEIVQFNSLSEKVVNEIVDLELKKLNDRLYKNQNITISYGNDLIKYIANNSYDPAFGARPIRRYIQKHVESQLANAIINGDVKEGQNVPIEIIKNEIILLTKANKNKLN
ncbi:ATPase associated with various cellular activities family protein [Chlamydia abortus]|nr:ATPase associated with various cellular activities family protein [Chlamydia abortus]